MCPMNAANNVTNLSGERCRLCHLSCHLSVRRNAMLYVTNVSDEWRGQCH